MSSFTSNEPLPTFSSIAPVSAMCDRLTSLSTRIERCAAESQTHADVLSKPESVPLHITVACTARPDNEWTLTITGQWQSAAPEQMPPFTSIVNKVRLELDSSALAPDQKDVVEWRPPVLAAASVAKMPLGFEIHRKSADATSACDVRLRFWLRNCPEHYVLTTAFCEALNSHSDLIDGKMPYTRAEVLATFWRYVLEHPNSAAMRDPKDPQRVICDVHLQKLFGLEWITADGVMAKLLDFMRPLPPVQLQCTVVGGKLQKDPGATEAHVYVQSQDAPAAATKAATSATADVDGARARVLGAKRRRNWYVALLSDPVDTLGSSLNVLESQAYGDVLSGVEGDAVAQADEQVVAAAAKAYVDAHSSSFEVLK